MKIATFIKRVFKEQLSVPPSASISPVPSASAGELVRLEESHEESPTPSSMSSHPSSTDEPAALCKV